MTANWFIGLPAPSPPWYPRLVAQPPPNVQVFPPEDLHLTIAFLGAVSEDAAFAAWALTDAWDTGPIAATLDRVSPMGNPRRASALAALVADGRAAIAEAMRRHSNVLLAAAGARLERREPTPHLTLARIGRRAGARDRAAALAWAEALPVAGLPLTLDRLALYTWSDDRPRRLFRVVTSRALQEITR